MVPVGIEERILRRSPPTPAKAVILAVLISGSIKSHITIAFAECGRHTIATTQTKGGPMKVEFTHHLRMRIPTLNLRRRNYTTFFAGTVSPAPFFSV